MVTRNLRVSRRSTSRLTPLVPRHSAWPTLLSMLAAILFFSKDYLNPLLPGNPGGFDFGYDVSYLRLLQPNLLGSTLLSAWDDAPFDGIPILGHPLTHVFYLPFSIPAVILGIDLGTRLSYVGSLILAGLGMFFLAHVLRTRPVVSAWVGLLFAMSGTIAGRIYAGHVERVLAIPLVPWILAAAVVAGRSRTVKQAIIRSSLTGFLHGCTFLAGDSYLLLYLLFVVPMVLLFVPLVEQRGNTTCASIISWLGGLVVTVSGKMLAAIDILTNSTRSVDAFRGSQDWYWGAIHLVFPDFACGWMLPWATRPRLSYYGTVPGLEPGQGYGWWEYTQYIGTIPVLLSALATACILARVARGRPAPQPVSAPGGALAMLAVCCFSVLWLANGKWYSPIHWLYLAVPSLQQFRVPSRALMLASPAVLALAGVGLEMLLARVQSRSRTVKSVIWGMTALALVDVFLVTNWIPKIQQPATISGVQAAITKLVQHDPSSFIIEPGSLGADIDSAVFLDLARRGIRTRLYTAPLLPDANNHAIIKPAWRVRYYLSPTPTPPKAAGTWAPLFTNSGVTIFENTEARGDAYLVAGTSVRGLNVTRTRPGSLEVQASSEEGSVLVFPANAYPGWRISIDNGPPEDASEFDGLVSTVTRQGEHRYRAFYETPHMKTLIALTALPWGLVAIVTAMWLRYEAARHIDLRP